MFVEHDLMPDFGRPLGKGDAMWRALSVVTTGDLVAYLDSDTRVRRAFRHRAARAALLRAGLELRQGHYSRPLPAPDGAVLPDARRRA